MPKRAALWVYHPAVDLIVGCGAWSAPLLSLAYFWGANNGAAVLFYGVALFSNYPHYMATIYRAYRSREDFRKYRFFTLHLTALMALTGILAHWWYGLLPWLFTLYVTWSPWHYTGQNFGLAMMFARRAQAQPGRLERNALHLAYVASYLMLFLSFHSGASNDQLVLSLGIPEGLARTARILLVFAFLSFGFLGHLGMVRRLGFKAMIAPLTLFSTQFIWFVAPGLLDLAWSIRFPQTRYSTGILAVMHSVQYLWITSFYARREAEVTKQSGWKPWAYFATLVGGGIALFVPGPWAISYLFHYDFTASFLIFTALVNIHHFVLDGAVWKLRDGRIAALLIESSSKLAAASARALPARWLRVGVAAVLLVLAGIDQAKFFLGVDEKNLKSLAKAEALNPFDASLQIKKARAESRRGDLDRTVRSLEQAISINPKSAEAQNSLALLLIENELYLQAYDHYKQMTRHLPRDVDAWVNLGTLAARLERQDEAIESWKHALSIDPSQSIVHLYVAEAYEQQGHLDEAIPHYEGYIAGVAATEGQRLDPKEVLYITLKLGQAYAAARASEPALSYFERTIALAQQAGERVVESTALEGLAFLFEKTGNRGPAAQCHQRALSIDASVGDAKVEGIDWFNYAQFLRRCRIADNLVLAAFLKSEELLAESGDKLDRVKKARQEFESASGHTATRVLRDLPSLVEQAKSLQF